MVVDWVFNNLYWVDFKYNLIMMIVLKDNKIDEDLFYRQIVKIDLESLYGLVVYLQKGQVFCGCVGRLLYLFKDKCILLLICL